MLHNMTLLSVKSVTLTSQIHRNKVYSKVNMGKVGGVKPDHVYLYMFVFPLLKINTELITGKYEMKLIRFCGYEITSWGGAHHIQQASSEAAMVRTLT